MTVPMSQPPAAAPEGYGPGDQLCGQQAPGFGANAVAAFDSGARAQLSQTPKRASAVEVLARYRKTIISLIGALLTWLGAAYVPDGHVSRAELYGLIVALATVAGVYAVQNEPMPPKD